MSEADYLQEIQEWQSWRLESLRSESGWLTLVGLYWLEPGENRFGSDPANRLVLSEGSVPFGGSFYLEQDRVRVRAAEGVDLYLNDEMVGERELQADDMGRQPDILRLNDLHFMVLKRGDRFAIRIKDANNPTRREFKGMEYFPVDPNYRVEADFVAYESPTEVAVPTVLGTNEAMKAPGYVEFDLKGRRLSLEPFLRPGDRKLFFILKDETSGKETYPAGRYLYADPPEQGVVLLDFNKSYTPPCAFTPYATCPYPPRKNWLPIRIEAGEKNYEQRTTDH